MFRRVTVIVAAVLAVSILVSLIMLPIACHNRAKKVPVAETTTTESAPASKEHFISGIPIVIQDYYKAGCETYACTMLLQGLGYQIDEHEFVDNYLIRRDMSYSEDGTQFLGPDMDAAFAGDIFTGHGINCPAMAKSINNYLKTQKTGDTAVWSKEKTLAQLCKEYIDNDIPVLTWVTTYMQESYEKFSWIINYVDENCTHKIGDEIAWRQNEHCMVLIGYNETQYIFCDSVAGKVVYHDKDLAETRFKEIGEQSVAVYDPLSLSNP